MKFSENLHALRKRDKITQEALADKLGVSRQSVSKWETGEAYPETDKLIALSDLFQVSLDELVRGKFETENTETEVIKDDIGYATHMDAFSIKIAVGVLLILIGVAVCVALSGYSEIKGEIVTIVGVVILLLLIAAAVFLFIVAGIAHSKFISEHPEVGNVIPQEKVSAFNKKFPVAMATLVSGIIVAVVFLIVLTALLDNGTISSTDTNAAICYVVSAFLFILGVIVCGLVYFGIQHTKYNISEYNKEAKEEVNPSARSRLESAISSAVMLSATAIFLFIGFIWDLWHPAWVVFPIGGIICGIASVILNVRKK